MWLLLTDLLKRMSSELFVQQFNYIGHDVYCCMQQCDFSIVYILIIVFICSFFLHFQFSVILICYELL